MSDQVAILWPDIEVFTTCGCDLAQAQGHCWTHDSKKEITMFLNNIVLNNLSDFSLGLPSCDVLDES